MSLETLLSNLKYGQDIVNDYLYTIVPIVMNSVNKPEDIKQWFKIIIDRIEKLKIEEKDNTLAKMVSKLREAIFKSYVIVGFPKTINALQQLANVTPENIKDMLSDKPLRQEDSWEDIQKERKRGKELFGIIYDRHTDRVIQNMRTAYPDLAQTALFHLYGPILGETTVLNAKETSLVTCAALMIQNLPLQLTGHYYGALHNGATNEDVLRVQSIVEALAEYYDCPMAKANIKENK